MIDDTPFGFGDSIHRDGEDISIIANSSRIWDMIRWSKSRPGLTIADVIGPILVWWDGWQLAGPYSIAVGAGEAWPIQEFENGERIAIRRVFSPRVFYDMRSPQLIGVSATEGLTSYAVNIGNVTDARAVSSYMAVDPAAEGIVPLLFVLGDPTGISDVRVHNITMRPREWVYTPVWAAHEGKDPSGTETYFQHLDRLVGGGIEDDPDDFLFLEDHRTWIYAEPGDRIEVSLSCGLARAYNDNLLPPEGGTSEGVEPRESPEASIRINGEFLSGGDLDRAGVGLVAGFEAGAGERQQFAAIGTIFRCILESRVFAVHNIEAAVRATATPLDDMEGHPNFHSVLVHRPQLRARFLPRPPRLLET